MSLQDSFKDLVDYGRLEKTYEIMGKKVVMRSLTAAGLRDAMNATSANSPLAQINGIKICLLARSVHSVDGTPMVGSIKEREAFWEDVQIPTLNAFFDKYQELRDEQDKTVEEAFSSKNSKASSSTKKKETGTG